ncbi:MAG: NADH:flavin oxidoreductase/NADH oxidase [Thermaerobacter sp.]|nr:NADH:flavin oxidoreductase/NADH oxidase [Thermaerobacter sp.]
MPHLFDPFDSRRMHLRNRIVMSPMCQYSARDDGTVTDWHFVHYGARAVGGVGLVLLEMTQVAPYGRLSPEDLGIWDDAQIPGLRRLVDFVHSQGVPIGVQLGHAGRKADPIFDAVGPSAIAFSDDYRVPHALDAKGIATVIDQFAQGARRALEAGFDTVELHGAHGYLLHQFLSPISNKREDGYGGDLDGRARLILEVADAVRGVLPQDMPVWARLSMLEAGAEGGYPLSDTLEVAKRLHDRGVDLIDCTTGGNAPVREPEFPGFRLPLSAAVHALGVPSMPVGHMEYPALADAAISSGQADLVALARGLLRNPHWALAAQQALQVDPTPPEQYRRAY